MALTARQISDLLLAAWDKQEVKKIEDLGAAYVDYPAVRKFNKDAVQEQGGTQIVKNIRVNYQSGATFTGLFEPDTVNADKMMESVAVPWRHAVASVAIEHREVLMNGGSDTMIFNLAAERKSGMYGNLAEVMEDAYWTKPASDDGKKPFGIWYYLNRYPGTGTGSDGAAGFYGEQPWDGTHCGGLDHAKYKNYTVKYTSITVDDLVAKIRAAAKATKWTSPLPNAKTLALSGRGKTAYTTETIYTALESLGEGRNDNLGWDLAPKTPLFAGNPFTWVPQMASDSYGTVYMVDDSSIYPIVLEGANMAETHIAQAPGAHNQEHWFVDASYNMVAVNLRTSAVLSTSTDRTW